MPNLQELFQPLMDAISEAYEEQRNQYASTFGQINADQQIQKAAANGKQLERWRQDLHLIFSEMDESELFTSAQIISNTDNPTVVYITPNSNLEQATGKKPIEVALFGKRYHPKSWKKVLVWVLEELYALHPEAVLQFEQNAHLNARRTNFSKVRSKVVFTPVYSGKTGLYVETNQSAISIMRMCGKMLEICGCQRDELKIAIKG